MKSPVGQAERGVSKRPSKNKKTNRGDKSERSGEGKRTQPTEVTKKGEKKEGFEWQKEKVTNEGLKKEGESIGFKRGNIENTRTTKRLWGERKGNRASVEEGVRRPLSHSKRAAESVRNRFLAREEV